MWNKNLFKKKYLFVDFWGSYYYFNYGLRHTEVKLSIICPIPYIWLKKSKLYYWTNIFNDNQVLTDARDDTKS